MMADRYYWYSAKMHAHKLRPIQNPMYRNDGTFGPVKPMVQVLPDGSISTVSSSGPDHGYGWDDMKLVGVFPDQCFTLRDAADFPIQPDA